MRGLLLLMMTMVRPIERDRAEKVFDWNCAADDVRELSIRCSHGQGTGKIPILFC